MMKRISLMGRKRTRELGEDDKQTVEVTELKKEELLSMKMDKWNSEAKQSGKLLEINLSEIQPDPNQPRKNFTNIDLLSDSIKQQGLIQPIIVRPYNNSYIIIAGERRFLAARQAKQEKIPCIVREEDDVNTILIQLLENAQREQVAPLEEAVAIKKLIDEMKLSKSQVAKELGQPSSWVSMRLSLLNASDNIKTLIKKQKLEDFRTIHELRKLEEQNPKKAKDIIQKISENKLSGSYRTQISNARKNKSPENKLNNKLNNKLANNQENKISDIYYDSKNNLLTITSTGTDTGTGNKPSGNINQKIINKFNISEKEIQNFISQINKNLKTKT